MNKNNNYKFKIKVIGIGDFGINIVESLAQKDVSNVEYIDMNTDWAFIYECKNLYLKIGKRITRGIGTGSQPEFGKKAAVEQREDIANALIGGNLAIIIAGLGGGTGSGASAVVAAIARELSIPTIVFATTPLKLEGRIRCQTAKDSLEELQKIADKVFEVSDEDIFQRLKFDEQSNISILNFYKKTGEILQVKFLNTIDLFNLQTSNGKSVKDILKLF